MFDSANNNETSTNEAPHPVEVSPAVGLASTVGVAVGDHVEPCASFAEVLEAGRIPTAEVKWTPLSRPKRTRLWVDPARSLRDPTRFFSAQPEHVLSPRGTFTLARFRVAKK